MQFYPARQCSPCLLVHPVKESDSNHLDQGRMLWFAKIPCRWLSKPGYEVLPGLPDLIQKAGAADVFALRVWEFNDHRPAVIVRLSKNDVKIFIVLLHVGQNNAFDLEGHRFNSNKQFFAR